ncbi:MAG: ExbD/TolR family protein [Brevundimonas sp.]|uniref:ExbD/TolR family protein n=1 Tax=Brevundimonas sp. TaxID=1871086 RepID=UPI002722BD3F|nr:ExbD/TolR family protein [Brevundimonas sp.]MDO9587090.1 ExbD/TolR family protein [Brevundimonas sp.]MDP2763459.1 ExbD/TolR family protein [Brevundimonas sp.]MDP3369457.1 ExbD/TolR family protein [Brevundimonas sp.]MDP3657066.1 ExbD/TolR family protein [Brevundimonas sp.]MDZ4112172.1 ExbD/TolR family protein [Brevundimonas sp.]
MALAGGGGGGHVRGRRRPRKRPLSEINVTPLVDVMLVLLIIFMISAPLLTVGVPIELPKTEAGAVEASQEPVVVSIQRDGAIYIGESEVAWDRLVLRVAEDGGENARDKPVFVRADGRAPYQAVVRVMARLNAAGFTKLNLITDTAASAEEG